MAHIDQSVEEILVLARHSALKKTQKNCALVEEAPRKGPASASDETPGRVRVLQPISRYMRILSGPSVCIAEIADIG
jgi:hypothetical protein